MTEEEMRERYTYLEGFVFKKETYINMDEDEYLKLLGEFDWLSGMLHGIELEKITKEMGMLECKILP